MPPGFCTRLRLERRGLEHLNTEPPSGTAFPDGSAAFPLRSAEANAQELGTEWPGLLERFFPNADLAFGGLGTELWSPVGLLDRRRRKSSRWLLLPVPADAGTVRHNRRGLVDRSTSAH